MSDLSLFVGAKRRGKHAAFAVTRHADFARIGSGVAIDAVNSIRHGEEFVVAEVDYLRRAFAKAQDPIAWQKSNQLGIIRWFLLPPSEAHRSHRMLESYAKIITILGDFEKHLSESGVRYADPWNKDVHADWVAEQTSPEEKKQRRLNLSEGFAPSAEIISIWTECLKELAIAGGRKNVELAIASASTSERAHQLSTLFRSTIGSFAQYLRYERGDPRLIINGRAAPDFQRAIYDQFQLVPDRSGKFLGVLMGDFVEALRNGWNVQGDWGSLELLSNHDVSIVFKPIEFFEDPEFIESEDVE